MSSPVSPINSPHTPPNPIWYQRSPPRAPQRPTREEYGDSPQARRARLYNSPGIEAVQFGHLLANAVEIHPQPAAWYEQPLGAVVRFEANEENLPASAQALANMLYGPDEGNAGNAFQQLFFPELDSESALGSDASAPGSNDSLEDA